MRWSAVTTAEAAGRADLAEAAAQRRRDDPASCPTTTPRPTLDEELAREAVGLALRRHAGRSKVVVSPEGRVVERSGKDLREVDLLVGSGGVLRHGRPGVADADLRRQRRRRRRGRLAAARARAEVTVDTDYVLAAAGLLAAEHPDAARRLVRRLTERRGRVG